MKFERTRRQSILFEGSLSEPSHSEYSNLSLGCSIERTTRLGVFIQPQEYKSNESVKKVRRQKNVMGVVQKRVEIAKDMIDSGRFDTFDAQSLDLSVYKDADQYSIKDLFTPQLQQGVGLYPPQGHMYGTDYVKEYVDIMF